MSKGRKQIQTPMRRAINALYDLGYYGVWAPGDVLLAVAAKHDVEVHELEGLHIDEIESAREADEAAERMAVEALSREADEARALNDLDVLGYCGVWAPADVLLAVAAKYGLEVHALEGLHIDEVEAAREADEAL